jgi:uncharacterized protein YggE
MSRISRPIRPFAALLAITLLVMGAQFPSAAAASDAEERARITVFGEGRADGTPDMASVTLGVVTESAAAADAMAENSARLAAVLARLREKGIAERDLQTSGLSLEPQWIYPEDEGASPRIAGYRVENAISVRVRDLDRLGAVLDLVVSDGANSFRALAFGVDDPAPLLDAARAAAVADARRKAEVIAQAAGMALGEVIEISEQGGYAVPRQDMLRMPAPMAEASVPIAAGEITFAATVTIVWALVAP